MAERPEETTRNPLDKLFPEEGEKSGCDGLANQGVEPSMNQMPPNEPRTPEEGSLYLLQPHSVFFLEAPQDRACPDAPYTERLFGSPFNLVISPELVLC